MKRSLKTSQGTLFCLSLPVRLLPTFLYYFVLTAEQLDALKFGLTHSICPPSIIINKTDIFTCYELISQRMIRNLKDTGKLVTELSHQAHTYVSAYRPAAVDLKKRGILKNMTEIYGLFIHKPPQFRSTQTKRGIFLYGIKSSLSIVTLTDTHVGSKRLSK